MKRDRKHLEGNKLRIKLDQTPRVKEEKDIFTQMLLQKDSVNGQSVNVNIASGAEDENDQDTKKGMPKEIHELAELDAYEDKRPPIHLIKMAENVKH